MESKNKIIRILEKYAVKAGKRVLQMQKKGLIRTAKAGVDFATEADFRSEDILLRGFKRELPGIEIISEEQLLPARVPPTCIVCDPLDGTIIYAHGCRNWGVTICYLEAGRPAAGVIYLPALSTVITAVRGSGCRINGKKIKMTAPKRGETFLSTMDICYTVQPDYLEKIVKPLLKRSPVIRSHGSAVGATIELLTGSVAAYLAPKGGKIWDFAASVLAVEEAGGTAVAADGRKIRWDQIPLGVVLAADSKLCREMSRLTRTVV